MKKKRTINRFLAILLILLPFTSSFAQRMMKNQKGVELAYGVSLLKNHSFANENFTRNFEGSIHFTKYLNRGNFFYYGMAFSRLSYPYVFQHQDPGRNETLQVPVDDYLFEAGYSHPLLSSRFRFFSLNLGMTGTLGYENVNNGEKTLDSGSYIESRSHFIGGGTVRLDMGFYIFDSVQLVLKGKSAFLFGTSFSKVRPSVSCGLRIFF